MIKPHALTPGDRLAVVAPASAFLRQEFEQGIEEIRRLGFEPVFDESVFAREGYFAGSAAVRAAAIRAAWRDPSIAGIIAVRGGWGSAQLLPLLDPAEVRAGRKALIGYSDVTTLLAYQTLQCGVVAFHGPMLEGRLARGAEGYDRSSFELALCRRAAMGSLTPPTLETLRPGEASGLLFGGTMSPLLATLGTPWAFDPPDGCVLFLEEVGERPYRLDRMITQFRQSGLLAKARAIVLSELTRCDEPSGEPTARAVMADALSDFPGPVLIGFPSGHTTGALVTLPFGVTCRVIGGPRPQVIIEESAVA